MKAQPDVNTPIFSYGAIDTLAWIVSVNVSSKKGRKIIERLEADAARLKPLEGKVVRLADRRDPARARRALELTALAQKLRAYTDGL